MLRAAPDDAVDFSQLHRVLVVKLRHHGDVLLASPVFATLKRQAPHLEVDALVYADTAPMLAHHPAIARVHAIDRAWKRAPWWRQLGAEAALLAELRQRRFDLLIHLTDHRRGAWLARVLGPRHAVAPWRAGRAWRGCFTHLYRSPRAGRPRHTVDLDLDALRRLGMQPGPGDRQLVMVAGAEAEARIDALIAERALARRPMVVVHPGSRWLFKTLDPRAVAAVIAGVGARGMLPVITGAPDPAERAYVDAVRAAAAPSSAIDLSGQLTLPELSALIRRARAFVGVDSAPMHVATAVGTPVVVAFGPSGEAHWGPRDVPHRVVVSAAHLCRPCGNDGCGGGKVSECLTSMDGSEILAALDSLLRETTARADAGAAAR